MKKLKVSVLSSQMKCLIVLLWHEYAHSTFVPLIYCVTDYALLQATHQT